MLTTLALLLLTAEPASLTAARGHLEAGKVDEVLFELEGQTIPEEHKAATADVLGQAASKTLAANDDLLALQLAQMALRHAPNHAVANEVAARASLNQQQFESAERYGDAWFLATNSAQARLFRAQLALDQADWSTASALLDDASLSKMNPAQKTAGERIRNKAKEEQAERVGAINQVKSLEAAMEKAAANARKLAVAAPAVSVNAQVVVYTTAWCGYCKQAKAWLAQRNIPFVEKDVEKDQGAAMELAQKAAAARVRPGGVPVIDFRGSLVLGFDKRRLAELSGSPR